MDPITRIFSRAVVPDTSRKSAIEVLDIHWMYKFWTPAAIKFDQAFANNIFCQYLDVNGTTTQSIPTRSITENVLEYKHKLVRDIYLGRKADDGYFIEKLIAEQSLRISNNFLDAMFVLRLNSQTASQDLFNLVVSQDLHRLKLKIIETLEWQEEI